MGTVKSKKILFHIHNLNRGGAERVVVNLSERFAKDGYEVLIAIEEAAEYEYEVPENVKRVDVGIKTDGNENLFSRFYSIRKRKNRLRELLKKEQPDLVIAFGKSANYRAVSAAKGICPVLVSVRNDPKVDYVGRMNRLFCRKYLYRADGCVFQTEEARAFFPKKFTDRSRIILNPINDKYLQTEPAMDRKPVIVTAGRIAAQKDQEVLIRAFAALEKEFPEYRLHIYGADSGDGTKEVLERLITEKRLHEKVVFCGNSNYLEKEIADSALFVLSSDYEGLPNALMEAMAMGLPVVSTDCPCGGPAMLIENGVNGYLVPVKDVPAMAEAMKKVLSDPVHARELGLAALMIRDRANGAVIYEQWKQYAEELMQNGETSR